MTTKIRVTIELDEVYVNGVTYFTDNVQAVNEAAADAQATITREAPEETIPRPAHANDIRNELDETMWSDTHLIRSPDGGVCIPERMRDHFGPCRVERVEKLSII